MKRSAAVSKPSKRPRGPEDLSDLPRPSDNLGARRANQVHRPPNRPRKPPPLLRKPGESESFPENLADAVRDFMAKTAIVPLAEQVPALIGPVLEGGEFIAPELPKPPPEDRDRITLREKTRTRLMI